MKLRENYERLKLEAYAGLQKRDSSRTWIRMIEAAPWFLCDLTRGRLLQTINVGMRILDDVADGDRQPPPGTTPISFLEDKQAFIRNPQSPKDDVDYLFTYCYELAQKAKLDIRPELDAFFDYFLFDARRRGSGAVFTRAELDQAYDACDITGTIRGSLMVFGDNPEKAELLMPLGRATRKFYTLRDYESDIAAGFVNIPQESFEQYAIRSTDLPDRFNPQVRAWFREEATAGLQLLDQHAQVMGRERFKWRGRLALPIAYVKPAKAYLEAVMTNQK
jgi:hypothetical protein